LGNRILHRKAGRINPPAPCKFPVSATGRGEQYEIFATDPNGDAIEFRKVRGPSYFSVTTLDVGRGSARGQIAFAPDSCTRGPAECVIQVSDGFASDFDTFTVNVHEIIRTPPNSPMQTPRVTVARATPPGPKNLAPWPIGEWEWTGQRGWKCGHSPLTTGERTRLCFHRDSTVDIFVVGGGHVIRWTHDRFEVAQQDGATYLRFPPRWWGSEERIVNFVVSRNPNGFGIYPAGSSDACENDFVRVKPVFEVVGDTDRVIAPVEAPHLTERAGQREVTLSPVMSVAIHDWDKAFRPWTEGDDREFASDKWPEVRGTASIIGDFDGDLLPDAALLGRSGADQVIVAVLSQYGSAVATEVAWRKVRPGRGENKSRGDPTGLRPIHLELVPRGTPNPFCWVEWQGAAWVDAIGIVEEGVGRFDYIFQDGRFVLFAPVTGSGPRLPGL